MSSHYLSTLALVSTRIALFGALGFCAARGRAQVFVVGEKTATADVVTDFRPTHVPIPDEGLTERGHLDLIRNLIAEQGFAHRELPLGAGLTLIANGNLSPGIAEYKHMLYTKGQSAGAGDRVEITNLEFKADRLVIDFNGGPYAKHRFLSHISINDVPLAPQGPIATGCRITLVFEGGLPEISAAEVKALLDPLVDFKAKSAAEAFANTLTPKVREAVLAHEVLVGMNQRTVIAAMGEPQTKHRERTVASDENSPVQEEWIYGQPPQPTQFVRFKDGRVVRLEIAAIGKPIEIREKPEVDDAPAPSLVARTIVNGDTTADVNSGRARSAPTLLQPGEAADTAARTTGKVKLPDDTPPANVPAGPTPPAASVPAPDAPKQLLPASQP